jgi:hypothetical protein
MDGYIVVYGFSDETDIHADAEMNIDIPIDPDFNRLYSVPHF